jgi:hypothetical protein
MAIRRKFKMRQGESLISQGSNEIHITGTGATTYLWIGGHGCYGTISGVKTLESIAVNILKALRKSPRKTLKKVKY